jgi:hypothetical protein
LTVVHPELGRHLGGKVAVHLVELVLSALAAMDVFPDNATLDRL